MARATDYVGQWARAGDLASCAHNAALSFTSAMTVQFWTRPFTTDLVSVPVLLCKGNVNTAYLVLIASNKLYFRIVIGGVFKDAADPVDIPRNSWTSWQGSYDGSNVLLHRGGSSTPVATTAATGNIDTNSNPFRIGNAEVSATNPYKGLLYDVRLFNTARSGANYASEYNSVINPATSGLVANWLFDEGIHTTVDDETASGLDLTIANCDQWSCAAGRPY
jgi:hypothetical protein